MPAMGDLKAVPLVLALLASAAWADTPRMPRESDVYSPKKTLKLHLTPEGTGGRSRRDARGTLLELTEAASGTYRYSVTTDLGDPSAMVGESGHVALFSWARSPDDKTAVVLLGPDGKEIARLAPRDFMTRAEIRVGGFSVSHFNWAAQNDETGEVGHRFDDAKKQLVLSVARRATRPTEDPGPPLERRIDLATGKLVGGPDLRDKTVSELLADFKAGSPEAHADARGSLSELHPDDPQTLALWRAVADKPPPDPADLDAAVEALARNKDAQDFARLRAVLFNETVPAQTRGRALWALVDVLDGAELDRLTTWLETPGHPMASSLPEILGKRGHKKALEPLLRYIKALPPDRGWERGNALKAAVALSDYRADVVALSLGQEAGGDIGYQVRELYKQDPERALQVAMQALGKGVNPYVDQNLTSVIVASVGHRNPKRNENFAALLKAAADPASPVAKSPALVWVLASMLIDARRFPEAQKLIAQGKALKTPPPKYGEKENHEAAALAQEGFLEWVKGNDQACLAVARKLEAVRGNDSACRPEWRPEHESNTACYRDTPARIAADLKERCSGKIRATCAMVDRANLEVSITNTGKKKMVTRQVGNELVWFQGGETIVPSSLRRKCSPMLKLELVPGKPQKLTCRVQVPWDLTSSNWPLRADIEVTAYVAELPKGEYYPKTRCTAFAER